MALISYMLTHSLSSVSLCPFQFSSCVRNPSFLGFVSFVLLYYFPVSLYIIHDQFQIINKLSFSFTITSNEWLNYCYPWMDFFLFSHHDNIHFVNQHNQLINFLLMTIKNWIPPVAHLLSSSSFSLANLCLGFPNPPGSSSCHTLLWGSPAAG